MRLERLPSPFAGDELYGCIVGVRSYVVSYTKSLGWNVSSQSKLTGRTEHTGQTYPTRSEAEDALKALIRSHAN